MKRYRIAIRKLASIEKQIGDLREYIRETLKQYNELEGKYNDLAKISEEDIASTPMERNLLHLLRGHPGKPGKKRSKTGYSKGPAADKEEYTYGGTDAYTSSQVMQIKGWSPQQLARKVRDGAIKKLGEEDGVRYYDKKSVVSHKEVQGMTAKEAQKMLRISPQELAWLVMKEDISPPNIIGGERIYKTEEIERLAKKE